MIKNSKERDITMDRVRMMIVKYLKKKKEKVILDLIIKDYKKIESIISELELCLADLDDEFQLEGISFALFNIGKILVNKEEQL